jgi:MFS transporter, DHA3 family, macrolide efflux protein
LRQLLRIRDFRLVWSAQATSYFGDGLTSLALLILTQRLTGSVTAVATTAIALPQLLFGLTAGVYIDRWNRKTVMVVSDLVRGVLVLGFVMVHDTDLMWLLYTLAFLQASVGTFFTPARMAFVPAIVGRDHLLAANSMAETTQVVGMLLGTAVAGVLAGAGDLLWMAFVIDAATFVASAAIVRRVVADGRPAERAGRSPVWTDLVAGIHATIRSRALIAVMVAGAVVMFGFGSVNVLFVPFVVDDLRVSEAWFGPFDAAQVAGMVLAGGLMTVLAQRLPPSSVLSVGLAGTGLGVAGVALVSEPWHLLVALFAVGWFMTPARASLTTLVQSETTDELRGRIGSVLSTVVTTANVASMALAGVAAALLGIRGVFVLAGAIAVLSAVLAAALFHSSRATASSSVHSSE